jgi:hypothetical protein
MSQIKRPKRLNVFFTSLVSSKDCRESMLFNKKIVIVSERKVCKSRESVS